MASKHAKLKVALTRAIIDFFLQEDLYADELKIQGTLCVTADRSAIFVTQITETVIESGETTGIQKLELNTPSISNTAHVPSRERIPAVPYYQRSSYNKDPIGVGDINAATDIAEDLTCKNQRNVSEGLAVAVDPPAKWFPSEDKPINHAIEPSSALRIGDIPEAVQSTLPPGESVGEQVEKYISSLACRSILDQKVPSHSTSQRRLSSPPGSSAMQRTDDPSLLSNAFLDAAARSAIERLTCMNRDSCVGSDKGLHVQQPSPWHQQSQNTSSESSGLISNDLNTIVQDTLAKLRDIRERDGSSSAKRIKLDQNSYQPLPNVMETSVSNRLETGLCLRKTSEASIASSANKSQPGAEDDPQPLMLVNPKRERVSDEENEPDSNHNGNNILPKVSGGSVKGKGGKKSPHSGSSGGTDWPSTGEGPHYMPSVQQACGEGSNSLTTWSFGATALKDEHPTMSVSDWSNADWMRKPRTKFSQEQLQALESEYQSDPFLSTSADKRAELAKRLSITEKNVQIWFQNQRRRRRAAAYSQMHYQFSESSNTALDQRNSDDDPRAIDDHAVSSPVSISDPEDGDPSSVATNPESPLEVTNMCHHQEAPPDGHGTDPGHETKEGRSSPEGEGSPSSDQPPLHKQESQNGEDAETNFDTSCHGDGCNPAEITTETAGHSSRNGKESEGTLQA